MRFQKRGDEGTDDIDFHVVFATPVERSLGEGRGDSTAAKRSGNFRVNQSEHVPGDGVVESGDVAVALEFEASAGDDLGSGLFVAE